MIDDVLWVFLFVFIIALMLFLVVVVGMGLYYGAMALFNAALACISWSS